MWAVYRYSLVAACIILMLASTTDGCLIVCNDTKTTKEKTLEQLQAHKLPVRKK